MNRDPAASYQKGDSQTLTMTMLLRFLGCSSLVLRIFDVGAEIFSVIKDFQCKNGCQNALEVLTDCAQLFAQLLPDEKLFKPKRKKRNLY